LRFKDCASGAVHGDSIEFSVDCGEEADDLDIALLTKQVECPRTVFAAAPGEKNSFHCRPIVIKLSAAGLRQKFLR
jgi:hypothetical protein